MNFPQTVLNLWLKPDRDPETLGDADPGQEIWLGIIVIFLFFVVILGGAAVIPLDAATYAPGEIVVAGHRLSLQHREGGVIQKINVSEGQHVNSGEVVVELLGADVQAAYKSSFSQYLGLEAERARLKAEQLSQSDITTPQAFLMLSGADREEADRAMLVQQQQFNARASSLQSHKLVLLKQVSELEQQIAGFQEQQKASTAQKRLVSEDLKSIQSLADDGYAPMSQVRSLQRAEADLEGRIGQYESNVAQARRQIEEVHLQIIQLTSQDKEEIAKQLRDVNFQLDDLVPKVTASRDQLLRTQIKAPQSGRVVGMTAFREGGVIVPGQRILDIVPDEKTLVIDAQIAPKDIEGLHPGLSTEVQLGALRDRTLPILKGTLTKISADALRNEKTGAAYFAAEVTIPESQLEIVRKAKGDKYDIRAGMPAQIVVPTERRTALDFLLQPLSSAIWRSFREK